MLKDTLFCHIYAAQLILLSYFITFFFISACFSCFRQYTIFIFCLISTIRQELIFHVLLFCTILLLYNNRIFLNFLYTYQIYLFFFIIMHFIVIKQPQMLLLIDYIYWYILIYYIIIMLQQKAKALGMPPYYYAFKSMRLMIDIFDIDFFRPATASILKRRCFDMPYFTAAKIRRSNTIGWRRF